MTDKVQIKFNRSDYSGEEGICIYEENKEYSFVTSSQYNVHYKDLGDFVIGIYYDEFDICFRASVQLKDDNTNICEAEFKTLELEWVTYNKYSSTVREDINLFIAVGQLLYNIL